MSLNASGRKAVVLLAIVWVAVAIVAGFRGSWDVVTAMVLSYLLGGVLAEAKFGFDSDVPASDEPPDGSV